LITKKLIDQIEGEASVYFDLKDEKVDYASIAFPHFRGIENILEGKSVLDALVITPRVCGICGHAHLMACVRAIESAYKNANLPVTLSKKAEDIREFTLILEIIQNHFKWLYMTIIPQISKLSGSYQEQHPLKGAFAASLATKALAIFSGQWPHASYMIPGGITCDPTHVERLQALSHVEELITFFEKECAGIDIDSLLSFRSCKEIDALQSDIGDLEKNLALSKMHLKGFSHDNFLILGEHDFSTQAKLKQMRVSNVDTKYVELNDAYSPDEKSYAKNATYNGMFYEVGPLSRLISSNYPLIKNMHRRFKDSTYTRVMARVFEIAVLLKQARTLVENLTLDEVSFVAPSKIENLSSTGIGVVEAPRGSLIHKVIIQEGVIKKYEIITPTQWNLGSSPKNRLSPSQQAMQGQSVDDALFIFRSFDVCSVCTTH